MKLAYTTKSGELWSRE